MLRSALGALSLTLFALGCGNTATTTTSGSGTGGSTTQSLTASFEVRGSVEQIAVWKAPRGVAIEVHDAGGALVQSGTTDSLGSIIFRNVPPGDGYSVTVPSLPARGTTSAVRVMSIANSLPPQSFYSGQKIVKGYNYITTRDGTKLAAYVTMPGPADKGP